jgi:hypothetical protein
MQQGSTPADAFKIALDSYPMMEMDKKIISQWPNNWFSITSHPSRKERTEFLNFILANYLGKFIFLFSFFNTQLTNPQSIPHLWCSLNF